MNPPCTNKDADSVDRTSAQPVSGGVERGGPRRLIFGTVLFLLVAGVFLPAATHDFITYDDPVFVTENGHVKGGLTWKGVGWAFRSTEASDWHPLTWLSHMADYELYGLNPGGHHLTNVLLHALNAVLLFVVLRKMTGAFWRSLFVAALFGLHPLHVESVAWISERRDVLSTIFWMLALWAYARRAELIPAPGRGAPVFYGLALLFFALGLMCKPMLVTLPCVLLLLDYWPLGRWHGSSVSARWALLAEKIPFFALSAAACVVTFVAHAGGGAVASTEDFPWNVRIANALIAYCRYLGKCFVPTKLAVFYPFVPGHLPFKEALLAGAILAAITVAALGLVRRRPYLLVGWLWFTGTLVPVIGLVQIGGQSFADRYSYVPLIGVFIMLTWAAVDLTATRPRAQRVLAVLAGGILAASAVMASRQLSYWRDSASLFRHALAVTDDNWVAHANLSAALSKTSASEAGAEYHEAVRILAALAETHDKRGLELERTPGHSQEAIKEFQKAAEIMPDLAEPHYNLGTALAKIPGRLPEAIGELRAAVRLKPEFAEAHYNLATALAGTSDGAAEAIPEFEEAVRLSPGNVAAHYRLGFLLSGIPGREGEAIAEYQSVIRLRPDSYQAHFNLGILLAGMPGRKGEAIDEFEAALRAKPDLSQAREMIERLRLAPQGN
jgi:tetratricopeptide (TPR) repeat protein